MGAAIRWVLLNFHFYLFIFLGFVFNGFVESYGGSQFVIVLGMRVLKSDGVSLAQLMSFVFNEDEGFEEG
jgi:hypothetical protein